MAWVQVYHQSQLLSSWRTTESPAADMLYCNGAIRYSGGKYISHPPRSPSCKHTNAALVSSFRHKPTSSSIQSCASIRSPQSSVCPFIVRKAVRIPPHQPGGSQYIHSTSVRLSVLTHQHGREVRCEGMKKSHTGHETEDAEATDVLHTWKQIYDSCR